MSNIYDHLCLKSLRNESLTESEGLAVLMDMSLDTVQLLHAAYRVRHHYFKKTVTIHVLNNAQNGYCPEDCGYCAQNKNSDANIDPYLIKDDQQILDEAKHAYESGGFRYCMVFSGRGPSTKRTNDLAAVIKKIKDTYPIEVCLSAGLIDSEKANVLKQAGLDRLNHNLNTSESHYGSICSTHTFEDRLNTLQAARDAKLELCSGVIVGMNEKPDDILDVAFNLRRLEVASIPVNFLLPIPGTKLENVQMLTPDYCLRALCLFRFVNPQSELRIAAGREYHLRQAQIMGLMPANSLFMEGYLNATGDSVRETLQMVKDGGYSIESDFDLDELLKGRKEVSAHPVLKTKADLYKV